MALTSCSVLSSEPQASDAGTSVTSQTLTPLMIRDAFETLGVFGTCLDPYKPAVDGTPVSDVTVVRCYVLNQDESWTGVYLKRNVTTIVARDNWAAFIADMCEWSEPAWRVVSDGRSFLSIGYLDDGPRDSLPGQWPDEVWPEDAQRVIGGEVLAMGDLCDRNGAAAEGRK